MIGARGAAATRKLVVACTSRSGLEISNAAWPMNAHRATYTAQRHATRALSSRVDRFPGSGSRKPAATSSRAMYTGHTKINVVDVLPKITAMTENMVGAVTWAIAVGAHGQLCAASF